MQQAQPEVKGFNGENRTAVQPLLPANVSPDAKNCDYSYGSIKKRLGFEKQHSEMIVPGSVRIHAESDARCVQIPYSPYYYTIFSGAFGVELTASFISDPSTIIGGAYIVFCGSTAGDYWSITYIPSTTRFVATVKNSINIYTAYVEYAPEAGEILHINFYRTSAGQPFIITVNGQYGIGDTTSAVPNVQRGIIVGSFYTALGLQAQIIDILVDELRIYSGATYSIANRELSQAEIDGWLLVGYWRFNEQYGNMVLDMSSVGNHGSLYLAGPSQEESLLGSNEGHSLRFDGLDDYAFISCGNDVSIGGGEVENQNLAALFANSSTLTFEAVVRVDNTIFQYRTIAHFGPGRPDATWPASNRHDRFRLYVDYNNDLKVSYHEHGESGGIDIIRSTGYTVVKGTTFHVAIVYTNNGGTDLIQVYVDGVEVISETVTAGNLVYDGGDDVTPLVLGRLASIVDHGEALTFEDDSAAPVTLDEVRLWNVARTSAEINEWKDKRLQADPSELVAYWTFDRPDWYVSEIQDLGYVSSNYGLHSVSVSYPGTLYPQRDKGLVLPQYPPRMKLIAPMPQLPDQDSSEVVVVAGGTIVSLVNGEYSIIHNLSVPSRRLWDWCHFRGKLIMVNGDEENLKYDGASEPVRLCIDTPEVGDWAVTPTGAGYSGTYYWRVTYHTADGTMSFGSEEYSKVITDDNVCYHTNIPVSSDSQVVERRVWRLDPSSSYYRYSFTVSDNVTTTYVENLNTDISANDVINDYVGSPDPYKYCAVSKDRLFLANADGDKSGVLFSEPSYEFALPPTNHINVDVDDGDEITGIHGTFGVLLIFKRYSIHVLSGYGPTTFNVSKVSSGIGCVSHATICEGPDGVYFMSVDGPCRIDSSMSVTPIGQSQTTVWDALQKSRMSYFAAGYDNVQNRYLLSVESENAIDDEYARNNMTMVYHPEGQTWAKWDHGFDGFIWVKGDRSDFGMLAAWNGFVVKLFEGDNDGASILGSSHTLTAEVSTATGYTITCSLASFPTTGSGLAGCIVYHRPTTASAWESSRCMYNTGTILYFPENFDNTPAGTIMIAPIDWYWESPWMDLGDISVVKRLHEFLLVMTASGNTITVKWKSDQTPSTWSSTTVTASTEVSRFIANHRGKRFKIRFENANPDEAVEIQSFAAKFQPRRWR